MLNNINDNPFSTEKKIEGYPKYLQDSDYEKAYNFIPNHSSILKSKIKEAFNAYIDKHFDSIYQHRKQDFIHQEHCSHEDEYIKQPLQDKPDLRLLNKLIANVFNLEGQNNDYHEYSYEFEDDYSAAFNSVDDVVFMSMIALSDSIIDSQSVHVNANEELVPDL